LAQLSEQDRNKVEMELAELNGRKQRILKQQQQAQARIGQLNRQRDQAMRNRNAAALLQAFNLSLQEQQALLAGTHAAIDEVEQQQQALLARFAEVYRTQHAYESIHDQQQRRERRHAAHKSQRQLDDMVATRAAASAS
jgi:hypothetical protein